MSEIKLLPCPFCGGEAILDREDIFCDECHLSMKIYNRLYNREAETYEEAREQTIETWNTRKPMERIIERMEEELKLSDIEKERCIRENPLQFDEAKGYSTGISNAIDFVKEEGGIE